METIDKIREMIEWDKGVRTLDMMPDMRLLIAHHIERLPVMRLTIFQIFLYNRYWIFAIDREFERSVFYQLTEQQHHKLINMQVVDNFLKNKTFGN